jgi:hypothetical protein
LKKKQKHILGGTDYHDADLICGHSFNIMVHGEVLSLTLFSGQQLLSEQLSKKKATLFRLSIERTYHLGSSSGWSMTGVRPGADTEVAPTASQLFCGVLASVATQCHSKPETTWVYVRVGEV